MKFIIEVVAVEGECMECDLDQVCDIKGLPCRDPKKRYKIIKVEEVLDKQK